jgi:uncharacterized membrane protein
MSTPPSQTPDNGKIIAILSYITWIGWIIALVMHNGNKTKLGAFHLRQALGLWIFSIIAGIVFGIVATIFAMILPILAVVVYFAFMAVMLYLWVMGLLAAVKSEEKPMPFIGEKIQSILKGVFAS